ncbi:MAG: UdgX family uracil-DNA binding protein [Burkholderiales bacterium]|nr:UdgX family uracil-DNA binding protein [Burkholderiales bacterium]
MAPTARRVATLADEADLEGFRRHARQGLIDGVEPSQLEWRVATRAEPDLFGALPSIDASAGVDESGPRVKVPALFVALAERAGLHSDTNRFGLLYRLLWRLVHESALRHDPLDADRQQAELMARAVRRDMHKMTAFVRFRPLAGADAQTPRHVAWFEPEHHIVEATAPFFARRFAQLHWAILTPERCVRWDGQALAFSPGANRSDAPPADAAEQLWLTYYASIFNPARLKLAMMQKEMPRRYWKNLPEAALIQPLTSAAAQRERTMLEQPASEPARHRPAASRALAIDARPIVVHAPGSLAELRTLTERCRACPIGAHATQAVNGEGHEHARLMLVGEQPGDREDLLGRPFVGPAGQLLDRALGRLGWPRDRLYLTNAVKHFKFELRGKRRIHKPPAQQEAAACLHWLESEIAIVKPEAAIALGATAARALLGREVPVMKERGQWTTRGDGLRVLVTLHPSALLRMDEADQASAFEHWLADLALAGDERYFFV